MFKQLRDADMTVGYIGGWCLKYVQDAFSTDHIYPTATAAWEGEPNKHFDTPPLGITVPVYLSLGDVPAGHVAIALDDGYIASSTLPGAHDGPYFHKSLDDLIAVYAKYNQGATYLGWGEFVGSVQVVQELPANATDDEIRQAYQEILERPADDGGLAHYRNYPIDFVRQDLMDSEERKTLLANKQAQADAAAAAQQAAEDKAKADAEAAARAQADSEARQKAAEAQKEVTIIPVSPVQNPVIDKKKPEKPVSLIEWLINLLLKIFKRGA